MTAAPIPSLPLESIPARRAPWRGALVEFLVVGGLTPLLFPLSFLLGRTLGLSNAEYAAGLATFCLAFVVNDPHFSVTYLLFYEDARARAFGSAFPRAQRIRWLLAGVAAPIGLAVWAAYGLARMSAPALGAMAELMFALVGWHYVKQGFGVMIALAARRGISFSPWERRAILAHCLAGWAFAWANPASPAREVESKGVVYTALAHPAWLDRAAHGVFLATFAALVVVLLAKWRREGRLPIVTPLVAMLASVWSWSVYSSVDPLVVYVTPALHSVQYLYFVWLVKGAEARDREGPPWFEPSARSRLGLLAVTALVLGWVLFHGAPTLLDSALVSRRERLLDTGPTPYFAAIYAFVNIHHYCMDAVIWRRESARTRYLVEP